MKTIARLKLKLAKWKFRSIYRFYNEYMDSHDGGNTVIDIVSSRRKDICAELNLLMEKMCKLEYSISGNIPFDVEKMKFE